MKRSASFGIAAIAAMVLASMGCENGKNQPSGSGGNKGTGGSTAAATGGSSNTGGKVATGGSATGGTSAGSSNGGAATGGSSGGSSNGGSTSASCGTTDGTENQHTTFGTDGSTDPYKVNQWGNWGGKGPTLEQTTSGPSGIDCGSGCAKLTIDFSNGTTQYSAGQFVQYFGTASNSTLNLLNETITAKVALTVSQADGASKPVPITVNLIGQDTFTSTTGTDNVWNHDMGNASALDAGSGWHTISYKVVDASVPSWAPTRTVCASALHNIGITIQNNDAIDDSNGAVVTLYVQTISVGPGGSTGGSGGAGGSSSGGTGGGGATGSSNGGSGGDTGSASGGSGGGGGDTSSSNGGSGGNGGDTSSSNGGSGGNGGNTGSSSGGSGGGGAGGSSNGGSGGRGGNTGGMGGFPTGGRSGGRDGGFPPMG